MNKKLNGLHRVIFNVLPKPNILLIFANQDSEKEAKPNILGGSIYLDFPSDNISIELVNNETVVEMKLNKVNIEGIDTFIQNVPHDSKIQIGSIDVGSYKTLNDISKTFIREYDGYIFFPYKT